MIRFVEFELTTGGVVAVNPAFVQMVAPASQNLIGQSTIWMQGIQAQVKANRATVVGALERASEGDEGGPE